MNITIYLPPAGASSISFSEVDSATFSDDGKQLKFHGKKENDTVKKDYVFTISQILYYSK